MRPTKISTIRTHTNKPIDLWRYKDKKEKYKYTFGYEHPINKSYYLFNFEYRLPKTSSIYGRWTLVQKSDDYYTYFEENILKTIDKINGFDFYPHDETIKGGIFEKDQTKQHLNIMNDIHPDEIIHRFGLDTIDIGEEEKIIIIENIIKNANSKYSFIRLKVEDKKEAKELGGLDEWEYYDINRYFIIRSLMFNIKSNSYHWSYNARKIGQYCINNISNVIDNIVHQFNLNSLMKNGLFITDNYNDYKNVYNKNEEIIKEVSLEKNIYIPNLIQQAIKNDIKI